MRHYRWETAEELDAALAWRLRNVRKRRGLTQQALSQLSGVSYGSLKRFERTGQISLLALTRLAIALECEEELRTLFLEVPYRSIEEVLREEP